MTLYTVLKKHEIESFASNGSLTIRIPKEAKMITHIDPSPEYSMVTLVRFNNAKMQPCILIVKSLSQCLHDQKQQHELMNRYLKDLHTKFKTQRHTFVVEANYGGQMMSDALFEMCQKYFPKAKHISFMKTRDSTNQGVNTLCNLVRNNRLFCAHQTTKDTMVKAMELLRKTQHTFAAHAFDSLFDSVINILYIFY